ncbi:MAG: hypothetical protein M3Y72_01940 [Acidobacteriota bacterium]|nr:hypothetical protein [Acidobacteriota bacterium]
MNWLGYFLAASSFKGKIPHLVLIMNAGATADLPRFEDVYAAVLLFEYRVLGMPTGAYSTDDWAGFRTVIAHETERAAISAMAADALLARGAQMVLISYGQPPRSVDAFEPMMRHPAMWTSGKRPVAMTLLLEPTLRATLAKLGKSTRFNLGYYRRRLYAAQQCEFIGDLSGLLQDHEMEALNRTSLNPVETGEFRVRYESACNLPGGFMLGLRSGRGQWLSLIGGWRQGDVTVLHWQMNAAGHEKLSIGTAMRSYFVEHEVERGARKLIYYGGTPHSLGNSFEREEVIDLLVRRRSLRAAAMQGAMQGAMRLLAWMRPHVRINSLLVQRMGSRQLQWKSVDQEAPTIQPQEARP